MTKPWQEVKKELEEETSKIFLICPDEIKRFTVDLLREAMEGGRFILGITENIPQSVRNRALLALADGVAEFTGEA